MRAARGASGEEHTEKPWEDIEREEKTTTVKIEPTINAASAQVSATRNKDLTWRRLIKESQPTRDKRSEPPWETEDDDLVRVSLAAVSSATETSALTI